MKQLNERDSMISETRQPFARRHNHSCVYYGVRGNSRSQYLWDKSCVLEGADIGVVNIGPGYAMPFGLGLSQGDVTLLDGPSDGGQVETPPAPSSMSTKTKVLLGIGAAAVIGGVALIATSKNFTSLDGARPKRRRRRRS